MSSLPACADRLPAVRSAPPEPATVRRVVHPLSWRGTGFVVDFILFDGEPDAAALLSTCRWARDSGLENPRLVGPRMLEWSSLFHPAFYAAVVRTSSAHGGRTLRFVGGRDRVMFDAEPFRQQSILFLSAVTMSAAIIQGRWSRGTIESKFDRLWQAATSDVLSALIDDARLRAEVCGMAEGGMAPVELLLAIRRLFLRTIAAIADDGAVERIVITADTGERRARFGFVPMFARRVPGLVAIIAYGSSVSSDDYADIDLLVVTEDAEATLRLLANSKPTWRGKELNIGVYTPAELWTMQRLSGDNLGDYGLCLHGSVDLPHKPLGVLLARNLSFGLVRQRQQLGMLPRAMLPSPAGDDRRNLYQYFTKIPANIAKGTFGATGSRRTKAMVSDWLLHCAGFDTPREQALALAGDPSGPLARAAIATGGALDALNAELRIVETVSGDG